jgi:hypothetical protein
MKIIKDNSSTLNMIKWHGINERGYLKGFKKNLAAVYIYKKVCNKIRYYVGSTIQLASRISSHRSSRLYENNSCPLFYKSIRKYG